MKIDKKEYHKLLLNSAIDRTTGIYVGQLIALDLITEELLNQINNKTSNNKDILSDKDAEDILSYILEWIKDTNIEVSDNYTRYLNPHSKGE